MASYTGRFRVWRGDADAGELRDFDVEVNEGEVVLDIIHRLQATAAPDLAVRWNCKAGKCGSCSAEINGRPRLMCMTRMSLFAEDEVITVTPLRAFPVVRDLVTDVSFNYAKARQVPSFAPPPELAPGDYRMAQVDVERSQEFRKCIECFLCQDTCHVIRDHEENKPAFAGPRFFIRMAELDMHPLDTRDRKRLAQEEHGLGMCNITKCCTEVCPEHIHITDNGIIPMKERVVDRKYDPLVLLGSRIPRRRSRDVPGEGLAAQGRFAEAAEQTRLATLPGSRGVGEPLLRAHAWNLLRAVEAGQLPAEPHLASARAALEETQRFHGSGRTLVPAYALLAVLEGDGATARDLLREELTWHRDARTRSEDDVTLATLLRRAGDEAGAAAAEERARTRWQTNPRLLASRDRAG